MKLFQTLIYASPNTVPVLSDQELKSSKSHIGLKNYILSQIENWTYTLLLLKFRINLTFFNDPFLSESDSQFSVFFTQHSNDKPSQNNL